MPVLSPAMLEHFREHGWVRVPAAFAADQAAEMREAIWQALAKMGICRDDPATWTKESPEHLQHLKADPCFRAIGSERTIGAIDQVLEGQNWPRPKNWGAFFLRFPNTRPWTVPSDGWHIDGDYAGALSPPCGLLIHAMLNDVGPRCGGMNILSGSHRLVHRWFSDNPAPPGTRAIRLRKSLQRHPYIRDLCRPGDAATRINRFHEQVEVVDGVPLQVLENTACAGDVILMHTLLLHAPPAAHAGSEPRFLLSQGLHLTAWWPRGK